MQQTILITGGAGFIGSHLADELIQHNYKVRIIDNLCPQVHKQIQSVPDYLSGEVQFVYGDINNKDVLAEAVDGVSAVFHLAAAEGVGQSMYEIEHYTKTNCLGTASLLEVLINKPVKKLIVASSMSVYGEGLYQDPSGVLYHNVSRTRQQLQKGAWEPQNEYEQYLIPAKTPEWKTPDIKSVYAQTKYDQERMCLLFGQAYNIDTIVLRFSNVFGPRQALSNPYSGVLAIFASHYLNDKPPMIYEDGRQQRDFVNVHDVTTACRLALQSPNSKNRVFNIASGESINIRQVAEKIAMVMNKTHIKPVIAGKHRFGDIRHCLADISAAKKHLAYEPQISLEEGLVELSEWLSNQFAEDQTELADSELMRRGLTI